MSPRITTLACTGLAVASLGLFGAAADAQIATSHVDRTWSKTYALPSQQTKTYRLQLPASFKKADSPGAANYTLYPSTGHGFAVGEPIGRRGARQKPYLGVTVLRSSFKHHRVSVTVRTGPPHAAHGAGAERSRHRVSGRTQLPSCRSQCHGGRHPRRSNGRHQAGERADQDGRGDAARPRLDGDHDGPALRAGVDGRRHDPGQHADDAADERRAGSTRRGTASGSGSSSRRGRGGGRSPSGVPAPR